MLPTLLFAAVLCQPPKAGAPVEAAKAVALADRLQEKIPVTAEFDGPFFDVGKQLADKYSLPLAFGPELKRKLAEDGEEPKFKLPSMKNIRLGTLLRLYCEHGNAAYLLHTDTIRITTDAHSYYEAGILSTSDEDAAPKLLPELDLQRSRPLTQRALLTKNYSDKSLKEILVDISQSTGATVVLAPTAQKSVGIENPDQFKLSASFANTPVDAAVRTLADMSDLAVYADANVLLVTTPDKVRQRYEATREKQQILAPGGFGFGGGFGCGPQGPQGLGGAVNTHKDSASKEDIEELKKQIAELKKK
jgi:hypothetical protein